MKLKKKYILFILACIFLIISLYFISQIYGKYLSAANGTATIPISRWNIKVNNQDIKNNSNISAILKPEFPGNDYIAANVIAPTAEGYFDLNFDFSAVDVAFKYDILFSVASDSSVSDFIATSYSVNGGAKTNFPTSEKRITETFPISSHITSRNIRVYVMWNDDVATSTMNNQADTDSANTTNNVAKFNVNIAFTQITGN